jgi:microcystin-dependent protein
MGSQPFIGQLLLVSFSFSPVNWYFCNGQLLPISQNEALYTLIGTTFGGDGVNTFAVPNLQGRVPVHQGAGGYVVGGIGGTESVTLTVSNYPAHNHSFLASSQNSNTNQPAGNAIRRGPSGVQCFNIGRGATYFTNHYTGNRRKPAPRESPAVSCHELDHCVERHFPNAILKYIF